MVRFIEEKKQKIFHITGSLWVTHKQMENCNAPIMHVKQGVYVFTLSIFVFVFILLLGYSRKNPHTPDGWHAGNSRGRGGQRLWKSWQKGGFGPKKSSSGVIFNRNLDLLGL